MQLLTDYHQFYDGVFDGRGPAFHRMAFTRGGLDKRAQFRLFATLGLLAPPHGTAAELRERFGGSGPVRSQAGAPRMTKMGRGQRGGRSTRTILRPGSPFGCPEEALRDVWCVVYTDELAHRGEGKLLVPLSEAAERHPACFASLFAAQPGRPVAFRHVRFGRLAFWLRQRGAAGGWRSNRTDEEQVLSKSLTAAPNPVPRVLWAIDFIPSAEGLLAVDFNTAPDLATLGETNALTSAEALAELELAAAENSASLAQF